MEEFIIEKFEEILTNLVTRLAKSDKTQLSIAEKVDSLEDIIISLKDRIIDLEMRDLV